MTRSELHALVWRIPLQKLGPQLGLSDCGLTKLCRRFDIPLPDRRYRAIFAAGGRPDVVELPSGSADQVIPRFRTLDANGMTPPPDQAERWLIPGFLRVEPRAAPGSGGNAPSELTEARAPTSHARPKVAQVDAQAKPDPSRLSPVPTRAPPADAAVQEGEGRAVAQISGDLDRLFEVVALQQRRRAAMEMLGALALRAAGEEQTAALHVLAWVADVRSALEADDPVARLLATLSAEALRPAA